MSKKCIKCGVELPDRAKFCDKCGAAVPEQKSELFCSKCGAKLEVGTKFCGSCGTPVTGTSGQGLQQFTDSAREAAQAGLGNAKRGAAKGMAYAAEKIAAAAEKMKDDTTSATNNNPTDTNKQYGREGVPKAKSTSLVKRILIGVGVVIIVYALYASLFSGSGQQVRQAYMTQFDSSITVEEAFDRRFKDCKWSAETDNGTTYIVFNGYDPETLKDWTVTFKIKGEEFTVSNIEVEGTGTTDDTEIYYLLSYIYTGNLDELWGDALLASMFF